MSFGVGGKYEAECTEVREKTKALGVILMVFHGDKGTGFSAQAPAEIVATLPAILRQVADQIEKSVKT